MTCIVGIAHQGWVWIGGDSAGVAGLSVQVRADRKVFRNGGFIMGFTSSFRMGQLLAHTFTPPSRKVDQDVYAYMVADFVPAVRKCFEVGGWAEAKDGVHAGGTFLVGHAGRLFAIEGDFQVGETEDGWNAVGCGDDIAKGVLWATPQLPPEERIRMALEASVHLSGGVRLPFHVERLEGPSREGDSR